MSDNGYYPGLNASITVIVNQDSDFLYPSYAATCSVVQLAMRAKGMDDDLECIPSHATRYECADHFGQPTCVPSMRRFGSKSKASCERSCRKGEQEQSVGEGRDAPFRHHRRGPPQRVVTRGSLL